MITLGDLQPIWMPSLLDVALPRLGVRGNHDEPDALAAMGADELHGGRVELGGWSFAGFVGCVRHSDGAYG